MVVKNEVPPLAQAESGQLLFGACQLPVNIVTEQRVTPARIATDDETGFLGSADGGQLEDVDALVLPGNCQVYRDRLLEGDKAS